MPKFANLANEKILKVIDSMNDGAEFSQNVI
jgi:hypothetical protein